MNVPRPGKARLDRLPRRSGLRTRRRGSFGADRRTPMRKERLERVAAFGREHAARDLGMVIELTIGEGIDHAAARACLRIVGAEHDARGAALVH